ncbi:NADH:flavin oxidoreductase/NADH oxidase [Sphingobacterium sp. N143]|uniref:NADH:flavin oxidoreductase/NADH oxidase n=1 Tax=Sphingobacterium sp. N143 TaxID=2746727 RepID=UPI002575710D|nr:NADH:flavin oxidoreductase/NADH oxidase [Sphingobacterium sp. N143]MDM1292861.1 NADH:flavin oxidoreductase/NADH oxidase [Sphingobacterium sp. N143]
MSQLFSSITIGSLQLKNRLVVSPMCQYSAEDGFANNWHLVHLGQFAIGGAAAVIQEATAISPEGRISYGDLGLWSDDHLEKYKEITTFIKENGAVPGIQLAHAGRKASSNKPWIGRGQFAPSDPLGWQTLAPSALAFHSGDYVPQELKIGQIKELIEQFGEAARRAVQAGYEIIELHAAHGYLIHQFLSPLSNLREDEFGGTFENRIRFLTEIINRVQREITSQSLWVRISATDWAENGWDLDQSILLSQLLTEQGVDVIDVSSGGLVSYQKIDVGPAYQLPFATAIKEKTGSTTATVGLIKTAAQAAEIIEQNKADLILIARSFLDDPHLPLHFAKELSVDTPWPKQYERAK